MDKEPVLIKLIQLGTLFLVNEESIYYRISRNSNRPCYSNLGSVLDQKNDNSNLSTSAVIIAGNMVHISNFWGEFDQQSDRNRGHYYGKYGSNL